LELQWRFKSDEDDKIKELTGVEICSLDPCIDKNMYGNSSRLANAKENLNLKEGTDIFTIVEKYKSIFTAGK